MLLGQLGKPFCGQINPFQHLIHAKAFQPLEACRKGPVKPIKMAFIFDHGYAGQIVEILHVIGGKARSHAFQKRQIFTDRHRNSGLAQGFKKPRKHGFTDCALG